VVLNLAPVVPLAVGVVSRCDPLVVNETEAGEVLGRTLTGAPALEAAAAQLADRARSVVVTGGASGAWVCSGGDVRHVPARPATVVDTTGAGDAFTGALAVGLALGLDLVDAAGRAAEVAAYSVGRAGAQASFPRRDGSVPRDSGSIP
jgi:ribokinase